MASVIKAGVVASACMLGCGRHVLVCASLCADINVSLFTFVYINAVKSLQASVRATAVRRGEGVSAPLVALVIKAGVVACAYVL